MRLIAGIKSIEINFDTFSKTEMSWYRKKNNTSCLREMTHGPKFHVEKLFQ